MRRGLAIGLVVGLAVTATVSVYVLLCPETAAPRVAPPPPLKKAPKAEPPPKTPEAPPQRVPMTFGGEGLAAQVTEATVRIVRAGHVQVAVREIDGARCVCILAHGPQRYFELDRGLKATDFPWIEAAGFLPAPSPVSRSQTSVIRSYARKAMGYDRTRGDRILILLCPRDDWAALSPT